MVFGLCDHGWLGFGGVAKMARVGLDGDFLD